MNNSLEQQAVIPEQGLRHQTPEAGNCSAKDVDAELRKDLVAFKTRFGISYSELLIRLSIIIDNRLPL